MKIELSREEVIINKITATPGAFSVEARIPVEVEDFPESASEVRVTSVSSVDVTEDGYGAKDKTPITLQVKTMVVAPGKVAKATLAGSDTEDRNKMLAWFDDNTPLVWDWPKED